MYNSGYSKSNLGLASKKLQRSKDRSCGYYMRIILLFSSLIQSLIIVSLVLFLIYGEPEQTVEEKRVQDLEQSYSKVLQENVALRANAKNLTQQLNITLTAKKLCDKDLIVSRKLANTSNSNFNTLRIKWTQCEMEKRTVRPYASPGNDKYWETRLQQAEELKRYLVANFTEQLKITKMELENSRKDRIRYQLEGIELRRDKTLLEERIGISEKKCKEDFIHSLQGIPNVTREFLKRVDDLFSKHIAFQLSCDKQSIQLENIRSNCSRLSMDVENKLQMYLDKVGNQVTVTVHENAKCITENKRLNEDTVWCTRNRSEIIEENKKVLKQAQQNYDKEVEKLLLETTKLTGNIKIHEQKVSVQELEIKILSENVKDLNISLTHCKRMFPNWDSRPGQSTFAGAFGSTFGTGLGSTGQVPFGRPSLGSSGIGLGSTGIGLPKPGQASGTGFSSIGLGQPNAGWPSFGSTGPGLGGYGSMGSSTAGLGTAGSSSAAFASSALAGTGFGNTGFLSTGPGTPGLASAGSSGSVFTRSGLGGGGPGFSAIASGAAGVPPFAAGKLTGGSNP
ncbi:plasmalemma vesicle associated protein a [Hoplias malabaricus]|uniref:plasmalemma vesicle associated protein a n=1 Tax=Hoplias malabaricus TaxID=27720 RepID=UPI003462E4D5